MSIAALPSLADQANHLIALGVPEIAQLPAGDLRGFAAEHSAADGALLAVHPDRAPASALAPLLRREGKAGFVVTDMADVDQFAPRDIDLPDAPLYLVTGIDRGDEMANWSPEEALPAITKAGRSPLLLTEGIHWVLQQPSALERNHCFMTIGSRLRKENGKFDTRTCGTVDQQRHRPRRQRASQRPEGRLVLVGQPAHLAGLRVRRRPPLNPSPRGENPFTLTRTSCTRCPGSREWCC